MVDVNKLCPGCMNETAGDRICSVCGYDSVSKNDVDCLNVRFILNERYVIGKVTHRSSEGITYLAFDKNKNKPVNIKEYFPLSFSLRNPDKTVAVKNEENFYFNEGLLEFIDLNKKLSQLEAASIIPVENVFEDNGTAYAVFAHNTGITLSNFLDVNGGTLKWEQARPLFLPLIDTIITLNSNGIIHGGISPESIIVGRDGKLRISNISIIETRFASEKLQTVIYPGCAAIEQYSTEKGNIGSFTDVYGLAATIFRVIIGVLPPPANERIKNDSMSIPSHFADELPRQVLVSLANALQVKIAARTQTVEHFRDELVYGETTENIKKAENKRRMEEQERSKRIAEKIEGNTPDKQSKKKKSSSLKYALIAALSTVGVFLILFAILSFTVFKDYFFPKKDTDTNSDVSSMPSVASIGEIDEGADTVKIKLYPVPNLIGKYYSQLEEIKELDDLQINIAGKAFSDTAPRGTICAQSVEAGKEVEKDTKIDITISLGPSKIKIADVLGLEPDQAKLELLKQGFLFENIEVIEKYDSDSEPGKIISQEPKYGELVSTDIAVKIYVNSYQEEEEE